MKEPKSTAQEYAVRLIVPTKLSSFTTIQDVIQDRLGFLWIGTNEGLHVLDGNDLLTYNFDPKKERIGLGREGDGYFRMAMGRNDILWVAENTSDYIVGIDVIKRKEVSRQKIENFSKGILRTLDNKDTYHIYTDDQEVTYLTCVSCAKVTKKELFKNKDLTAYQVFKDEHWVHADSTLYQFKTDGTLIQTYPDHDSIYINWKYDDSLRFYNSNLVNPLIYDPEKQAIVNDFALPGTFQKSGYHYFTKESEVWFSDLQNDFLIWDREDNTVQDYSTVISNLLQEEAPAGLSGDFRFELAMPDGSVIYSKFNTLIYFSKKKLNDDPFRESLSSGRQITSMRGLAEDEHGNIYASYYTGVSIKQKLDTTWQVFRDTHVGKREAERTYSLSLSKSKLIWNLAVFDLDDGSRTYIEKNLYGQHVNHLIEKDTLWIYEWYSNKLTKYNLSSDHYEIVSKSLIDKTPVVSDIEVDEETGYFWFATQYYGILVYSRRGELVRSYPLDFLGLPTMKNNIFFIKHEGDSVWFGTEVGLGLMDKNSLDVNIFNNPVASKQGVKQGRKIYSALYDENNNFYLGTDNGICFFDKDKLRYQNLIPKHPLANIEFNRNSMLKSTEGKYYFGSINGLYSFYPDDLKFEDFMEVPEPFIAGAEIFRSNQSSPRYIGENLNFIGELKLKPNDTDLTIMMGAPSFENEVLYRYKIPKLKDEWSNYTTNNRVEFVSFPSGKYDMQIRTYLRPESENYQEKVIKITKKAIWYKRLWIQILSLVILGFLIYFFVKRNFDKQLERKEADAKLRTKISSDLHDDVGSVLSGLAMQSELVSYSVADEQKESLREISNMSRSAMESMRDIVWAIDSRKDKYENLIDRMRNFAEKNLTPRNVEVDFNVMGIEASTSIDPESRQNYYLIFKEAITNIVKHSNATIVKILFAKSGKVLTLSIHDNGDNHTIFSGDGLGLSNMRMRAKKLGGDIQIDTDNGFEINLSVRT